MGDRLFIAILGHQKSGKSTTWDTLFGRTVKTGKNKRLLELKKGECVEVFLVSGSPQERDIYTKDILDDQDSRIVLCSIQYSRDALDTFDYVVEHGYDLFVQWLNPGYKDKKSYFDRLGYANLLLALNATLAIRDGTKRPQSRVHEIREFIYGWATYRGLIFPCNSSASLDDGED